MSGGRGPASRRDDRMVRAGLIGIIAIAVVHAASAYGGDHSGRELPPYALQPPGASFERTVDRRQYLLMFRETLGATCDEFAHSPLRSLEIGSAWLAERVGARIAGCVPHTPVPPGHQSPEAGGPCTPARITPLFDSRPAYDALMELIA